MNILNGIAFNVLSVLCFMGQVFSQELSEKQMQIFLNNRLMVEKNAGYFEGSDEDWIAYKGNQRISQDQFMQIARYSSKKSNYLGGIVLIGLGGYAAWKGYTREEEVHLGSQVVNVKNPDNTLGAVGIGAIVLGLTISIIESQKEISFEDAQKIAETYNDKLTKYILTKSNP